MVPGGSAGKEFFLTCNAGDLVSTLGWENPCGEGNGNPLQYPFLKNSMARRAWWATVYGITKSHTRLRD